MQFQIFTTKRIKLQNYHAIYYANIIEPEILCC